MAALLPKPGLTHPEWPIGVMTLTKTLPGSYSDNPRRTALLPNDRSPGYIGIVSAYYIHQMQQESFWTQWFPALDESTDPTVTRELPSELGPSLEIPITLGNNLARPLHKTVSG